MIMTNIALSFDPMIIRQSVSTDRFTPFQAQIYKITGAGGYGYMQALVCLIPVLIYHIKYWTQMIFSRKILIVILLLIIITMIRAQVFANLLAAVAITILFLCRSKKSPKILCPGNPGCYFVFGNSIFIICRYAYCNKFLF